MVKGWKFRTAPGGLVEFKTPPPPKVPVYPPLSTPAAAAARDAAALRRIEREARPARRDYGLGIVRPTPEYLR